MHRGPAADFPLLELARQHPARLYSVAAAAVALVAEYVSIPQETVLALVAALLGAGEVTQRFEDRKTQEAAKPQVRASGADENLRE
ncbi:hypothetical protein SMD11_1265 [Streptomyces albireticuli]|uniref:Uncharacterized protein n=2 Tax=Streptomyces albireticuli TaxID=1940 RepID=A0A1Z2KY23_9ACTN|nr:hypothetical protein SMD11_1265 [Streptomyces albireticuli]